MILDELVDLQRYANTLGSSSCKVGFMTDRPPTIRQRRLWSELRRLRERSALTGDEVAQRLTWSPAKLSRMENGKRGIKIADLRQLLDVYGVENDRREHLLGLARGAHERGWWDTSYETLPPEYTSYISLEDEAAAIRSYNSQLVSGLMQTGDYAREVVRSALISLYPPAEVERRVEARLARQPLLHRANPLELWTVMDEAVLRRTVGTPKVMREQYDRVVELAELPNVTIQVLSYDAGAHPATSGSFTILKFPNRMFDDAVYVEAMTTGAYIEEDREVHHYSLAFDHIRAIALSPDESLDMIKQAAARLGRRGAE